jgi:serine/threonine-protein kinase
MVDAADGAEDPTRRQGAAGPPPADATRVGSAAPRRSPAVPKIPTVDDCSFPPGVVLSNTYVIEAFLARGGMGEVYRARHRELGTQHAIKIIRADLARDEGVIRLFTEEARKLRRVREDAIVAYEGLFIDDTGRRFLVMEFVDGPSLAQLLRTRKLNVAEVRSLRDRIALGLGAAHEKGIFHRDLSPDNVILVDGRTDRAKVIDFGIAKSTEPGDVTVVGDSFAGKLSWVAPEQLGLFGGAVDARADIYSLGLLLASAAAGRPISPGSSMAAVIAARQTVPDLAAVPAELRGELEPLLQPDPAHRPASMAALPRHVEGPPPAAAVSRPATVARPAERRFSPILIGGVGAALVAALAVVLVVVLRIADGGSAGPVPQIAPGDRTASLQALPPVLARFDCAGLAAAPEGTDGIALTGFVSSADDAARAVSAATPFAPGLRLINRIEVTPPPLCGVRQLAAGLATGHGMVIAPNHANGRYRIDDPLIVKVTPPPAVKRGSLILDYIEMDGSVWHMSAGRVTGQAITAGAGVGEATLVVSQPTGPKMLLAVVSDNPLPQAAPGTKDTVGEYLPRLREAVAAASASGGAVDVEVMPLNVTER